MLFSHWGKGRGDEMRQVHGLPLPPCLSFLFPFKWVASHCLSGKPSKEEVSCFNSTSIHSFHVMTPCSSSYT